MAFATNPVEEGGRGFLREKTPLSFIHGCCQRWERAKAQFAPASGDGAAGRLVGFGVGVSPLFAPPCRQEHLNVLNMAVDTPQSALYYPCSYKKRERPSQAPFSERPLEKLNRSHLAS